MGSFGALKNNISGEQAIIKRNIFAVDPKKESKEAGKPKKKPKSTKARRTTKPKSPLKVTKRKRIIIKKRIPKF